ncbi:MAG TPA: cupredoxin domain-containing protein [Candidatus Dormibacteraeota bacterium]|nr:cupredoxin domain-containing protein [Candidatus Dormibacteraeota bacterium]
MQVRRRIVPLLHPGNLPARRGAVGVVIIVALFVAAAALGLYVAAQHNGVGPTAKSFEVTVVGAQMHPSHLTVRAGDQVVLAITGDASETVVLQGYQQRFSLVPGVPVDATFVAGKPGTFDFVLQSSGKKIGDLTVTG